MEWLMQSFESSDQAKLPMWMILTGIWWEDLLRLRKYGRRLVSTVLRHYHEVRTDICTVWIRALTAGQIHGHPDSDILLPLISKLKSLLNTLILSSPDNFVFPSTWNKYRDSLRTCLPAGDQSRLSAFLAIGGRNEQLVATSNRSQPAARHILVRHLDAALQVPMSDDLPVTSWNFSKDKAALAKALLEWCTSLYRPGLAKVFVSSRILQHWGTLGLDITTAVFGFLDSDPLEEKARKDALYHLVCELVRSESFSVSRYIQWLMARGGLTNLEDVLPNGPAGTRLLVELPVYALTPSQMNHRAGMLRRAGFSVADESKDTEMAIKYLKQTLGLPIEADDPILRRKPMSIKKLAKTVSSSCRALKAEIGAWLRDGLASSKEKKDGKGKGKEKDNQGPELPPAMFNAIRTILESAEDFFILAEALKALTRQSNVDTLAAVADTVSCHLLIFSALGASKVLFAALRKRLQILGREREGGARPLLASLVGLASRIPSLERLTTQLREELTLVDRRNPVDACSPVSDSMTLQLLDDDVSLHEEIEKNLASGSSLDRNTMERLFQTIVQRLHKCWSRADDNQRVYSRLLARLRIFDPTHFDAIMTKWLFSLRTMRNRPSILRIFPLLVSVGCLSMPGILATALDSTGAQPGVTARSAASAVAPGVQVVQLTYRTRYLQEALQLFIAPIPHDGLISYEESYRFSILQDQACRENAKELLGLIRLALAEYSHARAQQDLENLPLDDPDIQTRLLGLVKLLVLKDAPGVSKALVVRSPDAHVGRWLDYMATKLLIPTADEETHITFDEVLALTNEFTLPFCQVKLFLSLASNDQSSPEAADRQQTLLELFANAMDKAIDARNISWVGMLSCLSAEITHHLKNRAQVRFLDLLPSPRISLPTDRTLEQCLQMAESLLSVIDAIIRGGSMGRQPQLVPAMIDKFADLWEVLASGDTDAKPAVLNHWLPLLLNFITLHTQTFDTSKPSNEVRAKALIVCGGLLQELEALHGPGVDTRMLSGRIFDLACLLADNVTDEARAMCARPFRDLTSDARLRYIFSITPSSGETFMLSHREKPAPATGRAARTGGMPLGGLLGTPVSLWGQDPAPPERLSPFHFRRWEILSEPTPIVGENDTALSLALFEARKV